MKRGVSIAEAKRLCSHLRLQYVATWRHGETLWAYRPDVQQHMDTDKAALNPYLIKSRQAIALLLKALPQVPQARKEKAVMAAKHAPGEWLWPSSWNICNRLAALEGEAQCMLSLQSRAPHGFERNSHAVFSNRNSRMTMGVSLVCGATRGFHEELARKFTWTRVKVL